MNYFRERAVKLTRARARRMHGSRARHIAKELSASPSSCDKSRFSVAARYRARSRAYRFTGSNRRHFSDAENPLRRTGAYSNLYQHELKDYVINAR